MAGGELDRSAAYDYARDYLEPYLQENPDIQVIIDLHRDGIPEDRHLVTEINGKPTAQILFYNGLSYTTSKGSLDYLPNPYIQQKPGIFLPAGISGSPILSSILPGNLPCRLPLQSPPPSPLPSSGSRSPDQHCPGSKKRHGTICRHLRQGTARINSIAIP